MAPNGSEITATIQITNRLGLHARPAGMIVKLAQAYKDVELRLAKNGEEVNGKSIMGVLTLAAAKGESLKVRLWGERAPELLEKLQDLFASGFGETKT